LLLLLLVVRHLPAGAQYRDGYSERDADQGVLHFLLQRQLNSQAARCGCGRSNFSVLASPRIMHDSASGATVFNVSAAGAEIY